jgi:hypothetical protein
MQVDPYWHWCHWLRAYNGSSGCSGNCSHSLTKYTTLHRNDHLFCENWWPWTIHIALAIEHCMKLFLHNVTYYPIGLIQYTIWNIMPYTITVSNGHGLPGCRANLYLTWSTRSRSAPALNPTG